MHRLSVISGRLKNQKIKLVEDKRTRYTPAKVKNAIFSIIDSRRPVGNSSFLDLCAGSGQMGLEALSRGASFSTFVDISEKSVKTLKENVQRLMVSDCVRIYKKDILRFIRKPPAVYDIIFIDPPFQEELFFKIINRLLATEKIIKSDGRLIIECDINYEIIENEKFCIEDEYVYSSVKIEILKRKG